jgi:3'-5' exoribonuclease
MKSVYIQDLSEGRNVADFFLVREKNVRRKKNGDAYLDVELQDKTGRVKAKVWDDVEEYSRLFSRGDIVKIDARVGTFSGQLDLTITRLRPVQDKDKAVIEDFLPVSPKNNDEMFAALSALLEKVKDPWLSKLVAAFRSDEKFLADFRRSPAARDIHHAYMGGLMEHTLSVMTLCDFFAGHYPGINRDLLLTAAFLHDIGKTVELEILGDFNYTIPGSLIGHTLIGLELIQGKIRALEGFPERTKIELEHAVISHQGALEWSAPIVPKTQEALLLHMADNTDAKMFSFKDAIEKDQSEDPFTPQIRHLNRHIFKGWGKDSEDAGKAE